MDIRVGIQLLYLGLKATSMPVRGETGNREALGMPALYLTLCSEPVPPAAGATRQLRDALLPRHARIPIKAAPFREDATQ